MWTRINHSKHLCVCVYSQMALCESICWLSICAGVCAWKHTVCVNQTRVWGIFQGVHCHCVSILCVCISLTECLFVCCTCVHVHSDEAGDAAWRLIHHFPPWPTMPSEERCSVTVTLGPFWKRKMVHPPPALLPHVIPPPPGNTPSNSLSLFHAVRFTLKG